MPVAFDTSDTKLKRRAHENRLANDIIEECRVQLMLKFRFLDLALWRMDLTPLRGGMRYPLATDARQVAYDPPHVIARFRESFEESVRDYVHLVMHCIFRHPHDADRNQREAWELTCDIVVEAAVMDLCGSRFPSADDPARRAALDEIAMRAGRVLPSQVYNLVKALVQMPEGQQYRGLGRNVLNTWHDLFERDDHGAWPANTKESQVGDEAVREGSEMSKDDANPEVEVDALRTESLGDSAFDEGASERDEAAETADAAAAESTEAAPATDDAASREEAPPEAEDDKADGRERGEPVDADAERDKREWEDIARQIEMNLATFSKEWGEEAGSLIANLAFANRARYSYTDFLRRFMVASEEAQVNMDEFDYIAYTYGLELYGNMPLVEPLEYRETERVRDFVIAIDTSESVSGELVKKFVRHTFDLLKSSEDYARDVNIHLVQCDARVQSDTVITELAQVDRLTEGLQVRGFGGTDFRPVFSYVDHLRTRGDLPHLKGLIYFTDGLGTFPDKPPDYEAAFVFIDDGAAPPPPVPPWACKLLIDEAGINRLDDSSDRAAARPKPAAAPPGLAAAPPTHRWDADVPPEPAAETPQHDRSTTAGTSSSSNR